MLISQHAEARFSPEIRLITNGVPDTVPRSNPHRHPVYKFGEFEISPRTRSVCKAGRMMTVGSRAFDLLVLLVSSAGAVITKAEMFEYVWPATAVEESNLRVQMNQVRKVLGGHADAVITIPGRGYFFTADVSVEWPEANIRPVA